MSMIFMEFWLELKVKEGGDFQQDSLQQTQQNKQTPKCKNTQEANIQI